MSFTRAYSFALGPFADRLPNFNQYYDTKAPEITSDFGFPTEGYEVPWGKAQFVLVYDSAKVPNPPRSYKELAEWAKANPGRFTYPAPSTDFTGSAFLRMALYETTGGYQQFLGTYDKAKLESKWQETFRYLNELKPDLWRKGQTYPENLAKLDQLYGDGEVWMSMHYDPAAASNLITKGTYPASTRTTVFEAGTIANTHFLAIPFNASQKAGGMMVVNFLLSPEAQLSKFDPKNWGDFPAIDPTKVSAEVKQALAKMDLGPATLSPAVLAAHQVPEISADYLKQLQEGWKQHVAQGR
jgi:putative spermidine/putrescine transport system substrate-binding protein